MAADLGKLFGRGSVAEQLVVWQVLGQLLAAALAPAMELVQREANKALPATPLSAEQLADMVVRNIVDQVQAAGYARESGIAPADFARLVHNAGEPPSLTEAIELLRRGLIERSGAGPDSTSFEQIVAESRLFTKYTDAVLALGDVPLPPAVAVDGVVEGQISAEYGAHEAFLSGVSAERFQHMVNIRGNPPSPSEAAELLKRGLIPLTGTGPDAVSFQQAIFEGATKDKWWQLFAKLADYVPPPRTVSAMVRSGAMTDAQALQLYEAAGLTQELAATYLADAHHQRTQATRDLTTSEIEQAYIDRLMDADTAATMLKALGDSTEDAQLRLAMADFRRLRALVTQLVGKIRSLYLGRRIDKPAAMGALDEAGVAATQRDELLAVWDIELQSTVLVLTAAEVCDAVKYGLLDADSAVARLVAMGYPRDEAIIRLGLVLHGPPELSAAVSP